LADDGSILSSNLLLQDVTAPLGIDVPGKENSQHSGANSRYLWIRKQVILTTSQNIRKVNMTSVCSV